MPRQNEDKTIVQAALTEVKAIFQGQMISLTSNTMIQYSQ